MAQLPLSHSAILSFFTANFNNILSVSKLLLTPLTAFFLATLYLSNKYKCFFHGF